MNYFEDCPVRSNAELGPEGGFETAPGIVSRKYFIKYSEGMKGDNGSGKLKAGPESNAHAGESILFMFGGTSTETKGGLIHGYNQ